VISELYSGIRGKKEAKAIELFINSVDCLQIEQSDWLEIGSFICNLKKNGLSVPFQDSVLAYISIKNKCKILTNDKHFSMMKIIEPRIEIL
jgi:predicted nucleic acid-binding protein